jgi:cell division protein FtsL
VKSAYGVRQHVTNTYLVRQRDRRRRQELALVVVAVLPVAAALLGYVWLNVKLLNIGYEVYKLERALEQMEQKARELEIEVSYLSSPQQVTVRARAELGMVPVSLEQLVFAEEAP